MGKATLKERIDPAEIAVIFIFAFGTWIASKVIHDMDCCVLTSILRYLYAN